MSITYHLLLIFLIILSSCQSADEGNGTIVKGVYGNPEPFWGKGYELKDLGVNAIFVHSGSINEEMIRRAKSEGLQVYAEFATLNGKGYVTEHPDAWPVNEKGLPAEQASWFMGVCPTNSKFREYRLNQLQDLLKEYDLDGIWMDYIHWHAQFEEPEPILPETCFCEDCLSEFKHTMGIEIPEGTTKSRAEWILNNQDQSWRDWRCQVISGWVTDFRQAIDEVRPGILLGLYHCPWNDLEFNGARRRILGLDYDLLRDKVDVFSPMVYHGRMGRDPSWVKENITWFSDRLNIRKNGFPKIWTIVQAHDDPQKISPEEFKKVLLGGLAGQASGIMMFTSYSVAEDDEKTAVMQEVYQSID